MSFWHDMVTIGQPMGFSSDLIHLWNTSGEEVLKFNGSNLDPLMAHRMNEIEWLIIGNKKKYIKELSLTLSNDNVYVVLVDIFIHHNGKKYIKKIV